MNTHTHTHTHTITLTLTLPHPRRNTYTLIEREKEQWGCLKIHEADVENLMFFSFLFDPANFFQFVFYQIVITVSLYHRKLVMVCSRVSLCNNGCIFWFWETTKTPLGFALYKQGISYWTDAREFTIGIETDWDAFETITMVQILKTIITSAKPTKMLTTILCLGLTFVS